MGDSAQQQSVESTINVTENAAIEIRKLMEREKASSAAGLKVGVKGGGCSGLVYTMDFSEKRQPGEKVFEDRGIKLFVNLQSFIYLQGMTLDFSSGLNGRGFEFSNPNATKTCGCGMSFGV